MSTAFTDSSSPQSRPGGTVVTRGRRGPALRFLGHYIQMVVVMLVGMLVFVVLLELLGSALGSSSGVVEDDAPALYLLGMGFAMTAPMVWWMSRRRHSRPATWEMAGSMIVPTLLALVLLGAGATDSHGSLVIQHTVMFPAMFSVMLFRAPEYTQPHS